MYSDCHVHTRFSGDSDCPPEKQLEQAALMGMKSICFTDHHDHDVKSDIDFELDIPAYSKKVRELAQCSPVKLLYGIELGLQSHIAAYLEKLAADGGFDYIIGSVHFINGLDPYYPEYFELYGSKAYELYFTDTLELVKKLDCFDSLGHLDYIVRYGTPRGLSYSYKQYAELIDPILSTIIEKGKALECNTGALAKGMAEPNPCSNILKRYRELGGELITLGSDAHSHENLGFGFNTAGQLLKDCGFKYYAVYENRKPVMNKL